MDVYNSTFGLVGCEVRKPYFFVIVQGMYGHFVFVFSV